jgi:alkylhydroperoxidase family enzyme
MKYHAAVAAELLGSEELVASALQDLENSALTEKEKAVLRFVDKVNLNAASITAADMQPLYAVGWSDEAIYFAVSVCALFNFYNRWIDATGVHPMSNEAHRKFGKGTANNGYIHR